MKSSLSPPTNNTPTSSTERLALVSYNSLGDSLIYIMMAENLRRNGYALTLFGDIPFQLREWLPQLDIAAFPEQSDFERCLDKYSLVIISPPSFIRARLRGELLQRLRKKWFMICQKAPRDWHFDHTSRLKAELTETQWQHYAPLIQAGGSIRYRKFESESVVEMTQVYLQECMGLEQVSASVALTPPSGLQHRKYRQRIVVSPDSAWPEKKDWSARGFMRLCRMLSSRGYEPVIVVAPKNHETWQRINSGRYAMPIFSSITELAAFVYESGALIANDSGNGHLASFLDIPVVTIYRKRNPLFHWRPGWGSRHVVACPSLVLPGIKGPIWRPFIRPHQIMKLLQKLLADDAPTVPGSR